MGYRVWGVALCALRFALNGPQSAVCSLVVSAFVTQTSVLVAQSFSLALGALRFGLVAGCLGVEKALSFQDLNHCSERKVSEKGLEPILGLIQIRVVPKPGPDTGRNTRLFRIYFPGVKINHRRLVFPIVKLCDGPSGEAVGVKS